MKISEMFAKLHESGLSEVMLYLPDGGASRCHWRDTAQLGDVRVAMLGDQERGIVRIIPLDNCAGIGIPAPKGVDPNGYKAVVTKKVNDLYGGGGTDSSQTDETAQTTDSAPEPPTSPAEATTAATPASIPAPPIPPPTSLPGGPPRVPSPLPVPNQSRPSGGVVAPVSSPLPVPGGSNAPVGGPRRHFGPRAVGLPGEARTDGPAHANSAND